MVEFRNKLRDSRGLKLREEIHAQAFINEPGDLVRIKRNDRLDILKKCLDWIASNLDFSTFSVVVDKTNFTDQKNVYSYSWERLIQRFNNTIQYKNFPGLSNPEERGMIFPDNTDGEHLTKIVRRMRHYNPVPSMYPSSSYRNLKIDYIIEDPNLRNSHHSLLIQMVDVVAYFVRQLYEPNAYLKKKGATTFYNRLQPVWNNKVSSKGNGIVEIISK